MTAGGCSRTLRAAVFAAVCVLLASLGHVMMSEIAVPWWAMAAGATATGGTAWRLADRERGPALVGSVAVATQALLHAFFSLAQPVGPAAAGHGSGTPHSMGAMDHVGAAHAPDHGMGGVSSSGMLAAHLLAALLCALWLAHGERAAFRILRALAGWLMAPLRLLLRLPAPPHRPRVRARNRSPRKPRRLLLSHAITSRGPPKGTAVA
ncbi:conserved hypothetical protein [Streptomyces viridochromogenes DSM 40736]|uniref:Integral-membrane protein n=1 Tax=Streptomyces viridochromogenes (strain DSM 40736 / JCM 4977 / BCRC 1201 / Tue 494) TaxID=591159 RepID=D9X4K7_STRVT|nr:hypothetical protein [Streptomyces viridochromogenes]EFL29666.1 conserved hypothetical protein [Streptomyces viridochromogenes DSM 40736]